MIGRFKFNGIESDDFDLVCRSVKRPLLPAVKTKRVEIPTLSGAYDFDSEVEYELRTITMKLQYIGTSYEELRTRARSIASWLSTPTWRTLVLHDEDDKYYWAKVTSEIDLETVWEYGGAEIAFDCQPFAYSKIESEEAFVVGPPVNYGTTTTEVIAYPGTRLINYRSPFGSKFIIEVVGSWTALSLTLNGATLEYLGAGNGTLIIDNVEMTATLDGENVFGLLGGDVATFLKMVPGNNALEVWGFMLDLDVTIRYISLWI